MRPSAVRLAWHPSIARVGGVEKYPLEVEHVTSGGDLLPGGIFRPVLVR